MTTVPSKRTQEERSLYEGDSDQIFYGQNRQIGYIGGAYRSNWVDLHAAEDVTMKAGEFRLIPLGVAMKLPEGYEVHVVPRSSTMR